ncbi:MAG: hypothetical protein Q8N17_19105 [Burkholderiaceae bacterium]|nr:hypothetical protein [Burkholderiaceae bacterium]
MSSNGMPETPEKARAKQSGDDWWYTGWGAEMGYLLLMIFIMKPTGRLSPRERREVWLFRGFWFGTVALTAVSAGMFSRDDPTLLVTKCVIAAGSALLMWLVARMKADGYLQRQFFGASEKGPVLRLVIGCVVMLALGVGALLFIGSKYADHDLFIPAAIAMWFLSSSSFLAREAFTNFKRSRHVAST